MRRGGPFAANTHEPLRRQIHLRMTTIHSTSSRPSAAAVTSVTATLDELLTRATHADRRLHPGLTSETTEATPSLSDRPPHRPRERFLRLTVRFTAQEAAMLERARGQARAIGYKLSDSAVFRLALRQLSAQSVHESAVREVVNEDTRRREAARR